MDFNDILSLANKNQEISKKGKVPWIFNRLISSKKEKRDKTKRSEVVQKLMNASHPDNEKGVSNDGSRSYAQQNEKERKRFQIPKKTKIENLMKDLGSDDDSDKSGSQRSSSVQSDKGLTSEKAHDKQESYHKHEKHKLDSNDNRVGKHQTRSSSDKHTSSSRNSSSNHSSDRHSSGKSSSDKQTTDKHSSDKQTTDRHSSDKHSSGKHSSDKQTTDRHSSGKPTTDRHSSDKHSSERFSCDKNSSDKHKNSSDRHSSEKYSNDKHSSKKSSSDQHSRDINPDKSSERSSDSRTHSSGTDKNSASSSKKVKAPTDLSLEELRKQVYSMKEKAQQLENLEANQKKTEDKPVIPLEKYRQGVVGDSETDADKKARILAMMQEKKERMMRKLEEEKASKRPHKERGKRSGDTDRISDKMAHKVKSKSTVKDDYDSDDDIPAGGMDMSFNSSLQDAGCVDMKSIKKKIDEKLSNYKFEDKPDKGKSSKRSPNNKNDLRKKSLSQLKDRHKKTNSVQTSTSQKQKR